MAGTGMSTAFQNSELDLAYQESGILDASLNEKRMIEEKNELLKTEKEL